MATKMTRDRRGSEKRLPKPNPDLSQIYEFPAATIPSLREHGEPETPALISKRQDVIARDLKPALKPARIQALQNLAARAPAVRKLLGEKFVHIGVRTSEDTKQKSTVVRAMFYSYSNQVAVEAILDGRGRVVGLEDLRYQPAATDEEIRQADVVARRLLRKHDGWSDDLNSGVIAITNDDPTSPDYGRRLMDVRFFKPDERLAQLMAIVDLGKGKITRSGSVMEEGEQR
jgi:hypothetical protein